MSAISKYKQRLLTVSEVAEICGVAPETVRRLTDRGAMPKPVRLGRAVPYPLDGSDQTKAIEPWIDAGCPDLSKRRRK